MRKWPGKMDDHKLAATAQQVSEVMSRYAEVQKRNAELEGVHRRNLDLQKQMRAANKLLIGAGFKDGSLTLRVQELIAALETTSEALAKEQEVVRTEKTPSDKYMVKVLVRVIRRMDVLHGSPRKCRKSVEACPCNLAKDIISLERLEKDLRSPVSYYETTRLIADLDRSRYAQ